MDLHVKSYGLPPESNSIISDVEAFSDRNGKFLPGSDPRKTSGRSVVENLRS